MNVSHGGRNTKLSRLTLWLDSLCILLRSAEKTKLRTDVCTKIEPPEMDDSMLYNAINNNSSSCGTTTNIYTNFITRIFSSCCKNETVVESIPRSTWIKYDGSTLYDTREYVQQSDKVNTGQTVTNNEVQETTGFTDEKPGEVSDIAAPVNYIMSNSATNADLGDFLSRPVRIASYTWDLGLSLDQTFLPWKLFLNTASIKEKIQSYSLLRGNLHIKAMINASPFYYSAAIISYEPMTELFPATIVNGAASEELVPLSQRPNIMLYPQDSMGGELMLPFLYYKEWLSIKSDFDVSAMGACRLRSFDILRSANASAGASVTITILAWMDNAVLSGPTIEGVLQSSKGKIKKDEYGDGPVSKPASAIARATGALSQVPVIGPFMTATSMIATAVAGAAKIFGYTNPPNIDNTNQMRIGMLPLLATTDISVPYEKLTLDCKNELTIDPKVCGADVGDQMDFDSICSRESFLMMATWNTADVSDTQLCAVGLTPAAVKTAAAQKVYPVPMTMVSQCFKQWRGVISVRLKILSTSYHKGRLIITWDPAKANSTQTDYPRIYTHVLDIAQDKDITFDVPWMQETALLPVNNSLTNNYSDSSAVLNTRSDYNGILSVRVYTQLTAPVQTAPIKILVYMSGKEMIFAQPTSIPLDVSPYAQQSEFVKEAKVVELGPKTVTDDNIALVYNGESVRSVRTLVRRATNYFTNSQNTAVAANKGYVSNVARMNRRPLYPGYDLDGIHTAVGLTSGLNKAYNFVNWTYGNWFEQCYVGQRGSINYMFNYDFVGRAWWASRDDQSLVSADYLMVVTSGSQNVNSVAYYNTINGPLGLKGIAVNTETNRSNLVQFPFYAPVRFLGAAPVRRTLGSSYDYSNIDTIRYGTGFYAATGATSGPGMIQLYAAAGTDYSLIFFLNAPTLYKYTGIPVPPVL